MSEHRGSFRFMDKHGNTMAFLDGNKGDFDLGGEADGEAGQSGHISIFDDRGTKTIELIGEEGDLHLGGAGADGRGGKDGDLLIKNSRGDTAIHLDGDDGEIVLFDDQGTKTIELNGDWGNLYLGGAKADGEAGKDGDLVIRDRKGETTIHLDGDIGHLYLGGAKADDGEGKDGHVVVKDRKGETTIHLDGETGEIKIKNWSISVADYVFSPDYPLRALNEVSSFVEEKHHLPDVPSAEDIERDGIQMSSFVMTLLRKVEELTLYAAAQARETASLQKRVEKLENETKIGSF